MANSRTNEMISTALFEMLMSALRRLAAMPSAKASTGMLVRLETAMSIEFTVVTIQEKNYRYSSSAIVSI